MNPAIAQFKGLVKIMLLTEVFTIAIFRQAILQEIGILKNI